MTKQKGFTLIELLVVIAIIGILSAVVLTSLGSSRTKAGDTKTISDVKQVALAYELSLDHSTGYYPSGVLPTLEGLEFDQTAMPNVTIRDNSSNRDEFCVFGSLNDLDAYAFFVATPGGTEYSDSDCSFDGGGGGGGGL